MGRWDSLPFNLGEFMRLGRDANLIVLSGGLVSLPYGYLMVLQTIYLKSIGFDEGAIGIVLGLATLVSSLLTIPFGILSDRYSRKWIIVFGGLLSGVAWLAYGFSTDQNVIYASSVLMGLGSATFSASTALLAEKTDDSERTTAFSLSFFAYMVGSMVGALACGIPDFLSTTYGLGVVESYRPLHLGAFVFSALAAAMLLPLKEAQRAKREVKIIPSRSRAEIAKLATTNGIVALGAGLAIPLLPLWLFLKYGVGGAELGFLNVITNGLMAVSYLATPALVRRLGHVGGIVSVQLSATTLLLAMPLAQSFQVVALLLVLRAFLMNLAGPINSAFMMSIVHPEERASAAAICSSFSGVSWGLPNSLGQGIGGFMFKAGMLDQPLYACGALYAASTLLFYRFFRGRDVKAGSEP
jgi:predicted MFS family arabinose efflux permease